MFYEKLQNKIKKCSTFVFTCWKEHKPQRIFTNPFSACCYQEKEQKFDFATIIIINVPLQAYLSFLQTGLQEAYTESTNSRIIISDCVIDIYFKDEVIDRDHPGQ